MLQKSNIMLRRTGLLLCFPALLLVMWLCLQMRFAAEESIFISETVVASGYILCPVVIGLGAIFAISYRIKDQKVRFACLILTLTVLIFLVASLCTAYYVDYSHAMHARLVALPPLFCPT